MYFLILIFSSVAFAQITDASFFPSVRSINPGVVHMRTGGMLSVDGAQKKIERNHDVPLGGIVGGIQTDVALTKTTFFGAGHAGRWINAEILVDQEKGKREQTINSTTKGLRKSSDDASSSYFGGILDFRFFGISYAGSNFSYLNKFRVGTAPDLTARDEEKDLNFTNIKVGSAIKVGFFRLGAYFLNQKSKGDYTYTFYDPTSGNKGSSQTEAVKTSAKGYGVGLGLTVPKFRSEVSLEKMYDNDLDIASSYPGTVTKPTDASRISVVGETRISFMALGVRFRSIKGNYVDLEDTISTNLLYDSLGADDVRTETTFNFSLGDVKGFSPSAFYTQSEVTSKELSPVFDNGLKYKAVTKSKAYGVNLSYRF